MISSTWNLNWGSIAFATFQLWSILFYGQLFQLETLSRGLQLFFIPIMIYFGSLSGYFNLKHKVRIYSSFLHSNYDPLWFYGHPIEFESKCKGMWFFLHSNVDPFYFYAHLIELESECKGMQLFYIPTLIHFG